MDKGADKRKQSLYLPSDVLAQMWAEAERQQRSLSQIVRMAWAIARPEILKAPAPPPDDGAGA